MTNAESHKRVLFLCTENSARSQIAEAMLRKLSRGQMATFSAGAAPGRTLDETTRHTLRRHGLSVAGLTPKNMSPFAGQAFDYAITLCDPAREDCIQLPGTDSIRWSFPDPMRAREGASRVAAFEALFQALDRRLRLLLLISDRAEYES
jgi:ArsR family transcriptional regulator, arsenate/arsenite/antimonite-responsive transcriptional repressor / arsenate reductase (thioredoxin)